MEDDKKPHGGAGRGQGRKPLKEGVPTVGLTIRMTVDQRAKLDRLGGAPWVRKKIDQASEPDEPASQRS